MPSLAPPAAPTPAPAQLAARRTVVVLLVLVVALAVGYAAGRATAPGVPPVQQFRGQVSSLYPDGTGGCVSADAGQGVETGADAHCGPLYVVGGGSLHVGERVRATPFSLRGPDGEDVSGLLLAPA